jgi:hypothetical protein
MVLIHIEYIQIKYGFKEPRRKTDDSGLDHRHQAIIYWYKANAKYIPNLFIPAEIEREFGPKRKQAFYTVWNPRGKNYRPITVKELEVIIPFLEDFPDAQKAAINDLANQN